MPTFILIPFVLIFILVLYIRFAPQDIEKMHQTLDISADEFLMGGVKKRTDVDIDALHAVIMTEPRTKLVAGNPSEGRATYVTRSLLWGFPDYTTVQKDGDGVQIYGRLVFGRSDFGVNAARVNRWIDALAAN